MDRLKLHQDINVAVGSKIAPKDRAKKGQSPDMVPPAELGNLCFIYLYFGAHFILSIQQAPPGDHRKGLALEWVMIISPRPGQLWALGGGVQAKRQKRLSKSRLDGHSPKAFLVVIKSKRITKLESYFVRESEPYLGDDGTFSRMRVVSYFGAQSKKLHSVIPKSKRGDKHWLA